MACRQHTDPGAKGKRLYLGAELTQRRNEAEAQSFSGLFANHCASVWWTNLSIQPSGLCLLQPLRLCLFATLRSACFESLRLRRTTGPARWPALRELPCRLAPAKCRNSHCSGLLPPVG